VGTEYPDDAAVYRLAPDLALIQTVDFFPPVVDDPYSYGQIAAANALSDVYAMGGRPITAMNIVCFPCKTLGNEILLEILKGGADKVHEADALLVGGHTIQDQEPKYGLSVAGLIDPAQIWTKAGMQPSDLLILTKPLGTGILTTAQKADMLSAAQLEEAVFWMSMLNRGAAEAARELGINAATDITGFGLLGHAYEMVQESSVGIKFFLERLPVMDGVRQLAEEGIVPGGARVNKQYLESHVAGQETLDEIWMDILCDPQTSGGLLLAVPKERAGDLLRELHTRGLSWAAIVGEAVSRERGTLLLQPAP